MRKMSKAEREDRWMEGQSKLLSEQECAFLLGIGTADFRRLRAVGHFPAPLDIGGKPRWTRKDVRGFITDRKRARFLAKLENDALPRVQWEGLASNVPNELASLHGQLYEYVAPGPCVYFLYNFGILVYIGKTLNLHVRLNQHKKGDSKTPKKAFDRALFLPVALDDLDAAERHFIAEFEPLLNVAGLP